MFHMDLTQPIQVEALLEKSDISVCVDDCSRFCWLDFLRVKSEAFGLFVYLHERLACKLAVLKSLPILK